MRITTQPDSVRGLRQKLTIDKPDIPSAPTWLSTPAKREFKKLVGLLVASDVPIKQIDAYSIAMAANCITFVAEWTKQESTAETLPDKVRYSKLVAHYQTASQSWLKLICATPMSRAQIGLRSNSNKETGPLAQLLERKKDAQVA